MLVLRALVFDAVLYGLMGVMGLAVAPVAAVSRRAARWGIRLYCRIVLAALAAICGLRVEIRGEVPQGRALVVAKHQSFLDVLALTATLPEPRFVMKAELLRMPVFGWYARRLGCIPIVRERGPMALRGLLAEVGATGIDGQLVIYPEGTRVAPGQKLRYRPGAAALYGRFGLRAVPVATNAGLFWPRRSLRRRPGRAVIAFLDPIPPGLPAERFMAEIETRIETACAALLPAGMAAGR